MSVFEMTRRAIARMRASREEPRESLQPEYTQYTDRTWFAKCIGDEAQQAAFVNFDRWVLCELVKAYLENGLRNHRVSQQMVDQVLDETVSVPRYFSTLLFNLDDEHKFVPPPS